jgi:hypothetical protein
MAFHGGIIGFAAETFSQTTSGFPDFTGFFISPPLLEIEPHKAGRPEPCILPKHTVQTFISKQADPEEDGVHPHFDAFLSTD